MEPAVRVRRGVVRRLDLRVDRAPERLTTLFASVVDSSSPGLREGEMVKPDAERVEPDGERAGTDAEMVETDAEMAEADAGSLHNSR